MIYQEKVSFDGKTWYQLEWENVDFRELKEIKEWTSCESIEELESLMLSYFPKSNIKSETIERNDKVHKSRVAGNAKVSRAKKLR